MSCLDCLCCLSGAVNVGYCCASGQWINESRFLANAGPAVYLFFSITALVLGILGLSGVIHVGIITSACLFAFSIPVIALSSYMLCKRNCTVN